MRPLRRATLSNCGESLKLELPPPTERDRGTGVMTLGMVTTREIG